MKIAFTGKGGVGKTTLAGLFARALSKDGKEVLAVDCDPDTNLARSLGFEHAEKIKPIAQMKDMIEERMGVKHGDRAFFKLNPKIDDIPDKFSQKKGNIKLIVMGTVDEGGSGCMCPESTFIKNLLSHLMFQKDEHLVMDMEAGVEHFGRATAQSCDFVITVVEPSINAIGTARKIAGFAHDIGIKKVFAIGNKIRDKKDIKFIKNEIKNIPLIETFEFDKNFLNWDKKTGSLAASNNVSEKLTDIKKFLEKELTS